MKYTLFSVLFSLLILSAQAQSNKENLTKIIEFGNTNVDSLFYYAKQSQKSTDPCTIKIGLLAEASAYYKLGNFKKAETISLSVIKDLIEPKIQCETKLLITAYNRLFWVKKNQGKYKEAFRFLLEKQKVIARIETKDKYYHLQQLNANANMASLKEVLGLHTEALTILKETNLELNTLYASKSPYYNVLKMTHANNLNTIGNTYFNLGKDSIASFIDSAAVYYKKAFDIAQTFKPTHKNSEQLYLLRKVKLLINTKQYDESLRVLASMNKNGIHSTLTKSFHFYKSLVYFHLKKSDSTLFYADKFLNYERNTPSSKTHRIVVYDILANQYSSIKQTDSAYYYSRLGLKELAQLTSNKDKINKAYYQYRFDRIKNLNETAMSSENVTHKRQILIISGITALLSLFILYKFRTNKKQVLENSLASIDESLLSKSPQKKDYNIEKKVENNILRKLEELEKSKEFLHTDFNITLLAKKLETNTSYLSYILNNSKKQTFKQYITKLRINYLLKELKTNKQYQNYTIQYLGEQIGYTNASAFTRAFKKEVGSTPSRYIKSLNT